MKFDLIQRGKFRNIKEESEITGLDSVVEYDYMGSSEFEFGALGESLSAIMELYENKKFVPCRIAIRGIPFLLYMNADKTGESAEIQDLFNNPNKYRLKEYLGIEHFFEGKSIERLKRNCKKKVETVDNYSYRDFWWDIENDWFVLPIGPYYQSLVDKALRKLEDRKWLKEYKKTHPQPRWR